MALLLRENCPFCFFFSVPGKKKEKQSKSNDVQLSSGDEEVLIDPEITRQVFESWVNSALRKKILKAMAKGNLWPREGQLLGISTMAHTVAFLALQLFHSAKGIRLDVIRVRSQVT